MYHVGLKKKKNTKNTRSDEDGVRVKKIIIIKSIIIPSRTALWRGVVVMVVVVVVVRRRACSYKSSSKTSTSTRIISRASALYMKKEKKKIKKNMPRRHRVSRRLAGGDCEWNFSDSWQKGGRVVYTEK